LRFGPRKATLAVLDPSCEPWNMLVLLKRASRSSANLVWLMAFVFAMAPGASKAMVTPIGLFTGFVVHAHAHGQHSHAHHGHHHHDHAHAGHVGDEHQHDGNAVDDGAPPDQGQQRMHVHYDVSCPSVAIPLLNSGTIAYRVSEAFTPRAAQRMQGAPPDDLLRPPIVLSLL
jgi:hypothetical protein